VFKFKFVEKVGRRTIFFSHLSGVARVLDVTHELMICERLRVNSTHADASKKIPQEIFRDLELWCFGAIEETNVGISKLMLCFDLKDFKAVAPILYKRTFYLTSVKNHSSC